MAISKQGAAAPETVIRKNCKGKLQRAAVPKRGFTAAKRKVFLEHLASSTNVAASARAAGVCQSTAYRWYHKDQAFREGMDAAKADGYEHLEMELLHRARFGSHKTEYDGEGKITKIVHSYDDGFALRLLAMHRESANAYRVSLALAAGTDANVTRLSDDTLAEIRAKIAESRALQRAATDDRHGRDGDVGR